MTILVLGRSGQLARELARRPDMADARFVGRDTLDLSRPEAVEEAVLALAPSGVINAAAWTAVDKAESEEAAARALNALAPAALARACAKLDAPLVHVSTDYVFAGVGDRPWTPEDPIAPLNAYGRTKAEGEASVADGGARAAILRTSWVHSPFGANFVKTMWRLSADKDAVPVVADQFGRPTHAADLAEACVFLLHRRGADPARGAWIHHCANAGVTHWADLAQAVFDVREALTGKPTRALPIPGADYPTPARRPAWSALDTGSLEALGLAMKPWRARVEDCVREIAAAPVS
jgi:dTDP-4-dehydrorhamnose reductase